MDIIVVSRRRNRTWRFTLGDRRWTLLLPPLVLALGVCAGAFAGGWALRGGTVGMSPELIDAWSVEADNQRLALADARRSADENTSALARRIALLQAHVIRLDAAGSRMTEIAGLDKDEFSFEEAPPIGGPAEPDAMAAGSDPVLDALDVLQAQLEARERQMRVLEDLLLASRLNREASPSGWPVENGYISSLFGWRRDPFNGRRAHHYGIDFAGRAGSGVLAVAGGVITEAGPRDGYGLLVEINHGNGYVTRYGHSKKLLVKAGDRVVKGQRISLMGSSGRSTGPHVHFEVLLNGRVVNPAQYIQAAQ